MNPQLPLYQCHKRVRAAKITSIEPDNYGERYAVLLTHDGGLIGAYVKPEWIEKHKPEVGGYFVEYDDGYASYSPAKAFEDGYTRIDDRIGFQMLLKSIPHHEIAAFIDDNPAARALVEFSKNGKP
ncbi:MAG: hypothetical protein ACREVL_16505 [Solimonas sp.]